MYITAHPRRLSSVQRLERERATSGAIPWTKITLYTGLLARFLTGSGIGRTRPPRHLPCDIFDHAAHITGDTRRNRVCVFGGECFALLRTGLAGSTIAVLDRVTVAVAPLLYVGLVEADDKVHAVAPVVRSARVAPRARVEIEAEATPIALYAHEDTAQWRAAFRDFVEDIGDLYLGPPVVHARRAVVEKARLADRVPAYLEHALSISHHLAVLGCPKRLAARLRYVAAASECNLGSGRANGHHELRAQGALDPHTRQ